MSALTIENDLVHYEVLGRGRPVILLHGWLNSWRYWVPSMQQLSMKYRVYALDLWGYGDSSKDPAKLSLEAQVQLLTDFMDKLGISKAALIGHSLGGAVIARYALRHPERVARLMVISPPVFESSPIPRDESAPPPAAVPNPAVPPNAPTVMTRPPGLERAGQTTQPAAPPHSLPTVYRRSGDMEKRLQEGLTQRGLSLDDGDSLPRLAELDKQAASSVPRPTVRDTQEIEGGAGPLRAKLLGITPQEILSQQLEKDHPEYERFLNEAAKIASTAFAASALSFDRIDLAHDLRRLLTPTFLLHGQRDTFLQPPSEGLIAYMKGNRPILRCETLPEMGHFPMLSDSANFQRLLLDFLEVRDLADLVLHKERWVRTVR
ncbi:MAG: alpha/beta fold hydrolase [Anaerolineae bacterium]|nr:alpha/beta fold hydrolase [Anaerolineae bacterium]